MILALLILFTGLLLHYVFFLKNILVGLKKVREEKSDKKNNEFISVIIPFRNEEENLIKSVKSLSSQTLDKNRYEVIYVNDNSNDDSVKVLEAAIAESNIRILNSPFILGERAHKKKALRFAIENAKGEIIITTDADCHHKTEWLATMVNSFEKNTGFVSGPVEFISNGSLFNDLQKIEFSSLILVGAGLIGIEQPIICNAANLGFRKKAFNEVGGYEDNLNISSGDDEFLMQKISHDTNYEVKFCFDKKAISFTEPNKNIEQFYQQRKRWASKSLHYIKKSTILKLVLIFLFYLGIVIQLLLGFFYDKIFLISFAISYLLKVLMDYKVVQKGSENLFKKIGNIKFAIAEVLHIPYILISAVSGIFGNYKWKGREIKR